MYRYRTEFYQTHNPAIRVFETVAYVLHVSVELRKFYVNTLLKETVAEHAGFVGVVVVVAAVFASVVVNCNVLCVNVAHA